MPTKPPHECNRPGCHELTTTRYCTPHEQEHQERRRQRYREQDTQRGTATKRGYDARHQRWRKRILRRDPYCVDPYGRHRAQGTRVPSVVADHIVPLKWGGGWTDRNGQGLCTPCHEKKKADERSES